MTQQRDFPKPIRVAEVITGQHEQREGRGGSRGTHVRGSLGAHPVPLGPGSPAAWRGLLLSRQDGKGLIDLHHGDNEETSGQQEGGPEEREEQGPGPIEPLV